MARRVKPNLRLENLKYFRPPSPTPEERLAAKKQAALDKKGSSGGGLSAKALAQTNKDLDELFS
jgi:hypothetical protein